jgi:hypothetical protein
VNYFIAAFAFLIALVCIWMSFKLIRLYLRVKKWNKVPAKIQLKEKCIHPKYSSSRSPYGLKVQYTYLVDGRTFRGNKVDLAELAGGQVNYMEKTADRRLAGIPENMEVWVKPGNPEISVMYCKGAGLYLFIFFMGILSLLLGLNSLFS